MTLRRKYTIATLRIMAFFVVAFFGTYLTSFLQAQGVFGDAPCYAPYGCGSVDRGFVWGARHYWYYWGSIVAAILYFIDIAIPLLED